MKISLSDSHYMCRLTSYKLSINHPNPQSDHAEALAQEQQRSQTLTDKLTSSLAERRDLEAELDTLKFKFAEAVSKRTELEDVLSELEKKVNFVTSR